MQMPEPFLCEREPQCIEQLVRPPATPMHRLASRRLILYRKSRFPIRTCFLYFDRLEALAASPLTSALLLTTNKANPTNAQYSVILFVPFVLCLVKPFLVRSWFRDSGRFDAFLEASRAKSVIPERRASENETVGNPEVHL